MESRYRTGASTRQAPLPRHDALALLVSSLIVLSLLAMASLSIDYCLACLA